MGRGGYTAVHSQYCGAFDDADLVICRAGATTCAEVAAAGRAALMIPLPSAADDHQRKNAEAMVEKGAGKMLLQADLSAARALPTEINDLIDHPEQLSQIGRGGTRNWAKPDADTNDSRPDRGSWLRVNKIMFSHVKRIHFIGIGGIGMSGIAEVLCNLGFVVSGSDVKKSKNTERLETLFKIRIAEGHAAENVQDSQVVVYSSAVKEDNPEVVFAKEQGIPVIPRAEMLAELMTLKPYAVAVSGTHGKTSTTSMIATILGHAGFDPTTVVGGVVDTLGSNARLGSSDWFVTEADESDRSFLMLYPTIAVVTNIDKEHMESYKGMDDVVQCFTDFVNKVPFYGAAIICLDDPNVQLIIPKIRRRRVTYGMTAQADVSAKDIRYQRSFRLDIHGLKRREVLGR